MQDQLDPAKLTSVDQFGDRVSIIPAEVRGFFHRHRTWTQLVLLVIFLSLPWLYIGGHQSILLDIPERRFTFFGLVLRAHETPLLFFLLVILTLGLALITAIWGRIWCGWACPQTVFIEAVYRRIERWTEGNYIERRKLRSAPLSWNKFYKKSFKWCLFFIVSSLIAHSFLAYFVGSHELMQMMKNPPKENWSYFLLVSFFTALVLFDFAWFREQFCVIMCPYGRIQSVLLEPSSLSIVYDAKRGEPRRGTSSDKAPDKAGDCVACNRCVQVCPTGIDIRNGLQMECIACTACADACDEIMEKVHKPKGLIGYKTLNGSKFRLFKLKTLAYGLLIILSLSGLLYNLGSREEVGITVLRAIDTPFTLSSESGDTKVLNHFRLHMNSQSSVDNTYRLNLMEPYVSRKVELIVAQNPLLLREGKSETWHIFAKAPLSLFSPDGQLRIKIQILKENSQTSYEQELLLLGPKK